MSTDADIAIIGGGIAGATLAAQLLQRDVNVQVFDASTVGQSSTVAAGLMTPVTGKKLKAQPQFRHWLDTAVTHYRNIENASGMHFLSKRPALRLLDHAPQRQLWLNRDKGLAALADEHGPTSSFADSSNATVIHMPEAARLDTCAYLQAVKRILGKRWHSDVSIDAAELIPTGQAVLIPSVGISARLVVFCRGWRDHDNPWFNALQWRPAKGQVLRVRSDRIDPAYTLHANGIWLTHAENDHYLCGATYSWSDFETGPSENDTQLLVRKLAAMVGDVFEVVSSDAGVRPIVAGRQPVIGYSAKTSLVGLFNGLGSKGSLLAPLLAQQWVESLISKRSFDPSYDVQVRIHSQ